MAQALALIIIAIILKLLWDYVRAQIPKQEQKTKKNRRKGEVIDISDAWINASSLPYASREFLLSNKELALYNQIEAVLADSAYVIAPKIRMDEVLIVSPQADHYQEYLARLKERVLDMVILEKPALKPVLAIHFEGMNDQRKKQIADQFKDRALKAADLPSITLSLNHDWEQRQIEAELRKAGLHIQEFISS